MTPKKSPIKAVEKRKEDRKQTRKVLQDPEKIKALLRLLGEKV